VAALLFAGVVWQWRMVSLGSLSAAAAMPLLIGFTGGTAAVVLLSAWPGLASASQRERASAPSPVAFTVTFRIWSASVK
jgi:hypothetical protein